jgi:ankyrin repeat protein
MLASYHGHAQLVTLLLQHGADPNRLNDRGQSPLAGAVFKNERDVIQALLAGNADPQIGQPSALDACKVCSFFLSVVSYGQGHGLKLMYVADFQAGRIRGHI